MRLAVIDASVALSWVIPDEVPAPSTLRLLLAHHGSQVRLIAPSLWAYEVANALKVGVARGRLSAEEGWEALSALLDLDVTLVDFAAIAQSVWRLAQEHRLSIYDAAYLALAENRDCPLYTADKGLLEAGRSTGRARPMGDFE